MPSKEAKRNAPSEISLRGAFEGVTLQRSATGVLTVDVSAWGGLNVTVITGGAVTLQAPAREQTNATDAAPRASVYSRAYEIGAVLPDCWVVGPVSPDTGIVMSIEPAAGASDGYKTWHQGEEHAAELRGKGNAYAAARQPSDEELNALYNEIVKAGRNGNAKFDTSGSYPHGRYWASTTHPDPSYRDNARIQYFDDGHQIWYCKLNAIARVRCVRDEPGLRLAT